MYTHTHTTGILEASTTSGGLGVSSGRSDVQDSEVMDDLLRASQKNGQLSVYSVGLWSFGVWLGLQGLEFPGLGLRCFWSFPSNITTARALLPPTRLEHKKEASQRAS